MLTYRFSAEDRCRGIGMWCSHSNMICSIICLHFLLPLTTVIAHDTPHYFYYSIYPSILSFPPMALLNIPRYNQFPLVDWTATPMEVLCPSIHICSGHVAKLKSFVSSLIICLWPNTAPKEKGLLLSVNWYSPNTPLFLLSKDFVFPMPLAQSLACLTARRPQLDSLTSDWEELHKRKSRKQRPKCASSARPAINK